MPDESTKRAAQEYIAAKLSEEGQIFEGQLNLEAAMLLAPSVWKKVADNVVAQCREWNSVTKEQSLTCKETALGDLRIWCSGRAPHQMLVHFDSQKRVVVIKNTARPENEGDTVLLIEGYPTGEGRDAHLARNNQPINLDMLILAHLRVLAGLSRQTS
jgi:hypothetical protein